MAAKTFSLIPPTGRTKPRRVISPVMATSLRTGLPVRREVRAVNMVTPAEGPSLGIAPAGTWIWMSLLLEEVFGDLEILRLGADIAQGRLGRLLHDVPQLAGQGEALSPLICVASTKMISPPVGVQARPVATPGSEVRSATSEKNLIGPRNE